MAWAPLLPTLARRGHAARCRPLFRRVLDHLDYWLTPEVYGWRTRCVASGSMVIRPTDRDRRIGDGSEIGSY